jgi:hypothetical protein
VRAALEAHIQRAASRSSAKDDIIKRIGWSALPGGHAGDAVVNAPTRSSSGDPGDPEHAPGRTRRALPARSGQCLIEQAPELAAIFPQIVQVIGNVRAQVFEKESAGIVIAGPGDLPPPGTPTQ